MHRLIKKAEEAKRESKTVEFKTKFDVAATEDWCELIKDLVAMANSGGGVIVIGCDSSGHHSGADLAPVLALDPAPISDKIHKYTETHFSDFEVHELKRGAKACAAILVGPASIPLVFCQAGTYQDPANQNRQKTAFAKGTIFFRHGAKSEPGSTEDVRQAIDRRLDEIRKEWIGGVRKVVGAPAGSIVTVLPPEMLDSTSPTATAIRLVDDASAPAVRAIDFDKTHPHRQKELVGAMKKRLPSGVRFNSHDVLAIRRVHGIESRPEFFHRFTWGGCQYSDRCADWIAQQHAQDNTFLEKTRERFFWMSREVQVRKKK